jgi:hypothetical protein
MVDVLKAATAVAAALLMLLAVTVMAAGSLIQAGLLFLSASLVIYFREKRLSP